MTTALRRMRILIVALAVGALGVGASAAVAEPLRLPECQDPTADGPCGSDLGCQRYCDRLFGTGTGGFCAESEYCCYCTLA